MVQQPLKVRRAEQGDIAYIVDLSRRVQEKLTASGSLQQIGPIPRETVEAQVNAGTAHILDGGLRRLGSVFVEPVTIKSLGRWKLDDAALKPWFLHKLMLEPGEQGRGLGAHFLEGIKAYELPGSQGPSLFSTAGRETTSCGISIRGQASSCMACFPRMASRWRCLYIVLRGLAVTK